MSVTHDIPRLQLPSVLQNPRPITVALHFKPEDAPKLWDLAARHYDHGEEVSTIAKAARCAERGVALVLEVTMKSQLEEVAAFFPKHGIEAPRMETLRV